MMKLLLPLGLLGLLSIIVLIIIYIIKPNYQQKFISSTYVWKLSLAYRKKKVPISKLRNILLIICQVLLLTSCAMMLAGPYLAEEQTAEIPEQIVLIDASASMQTVNSDGTRFQRAVDKLNNSLDDIFAQNTYFSLIIVDNDPRYLVRRANVSQVEDIRLTLSEMMDGKDGINPICTFGTPNITGAMTLCEEILVENPYAKISFYTDTEYIDSDEKVTVVTDGIIDHEEWNAAILDGRVSTNEYNTYRFELDVASYGKSADFKIVMRIKGARAKYGEDNYVESYIESGSGNDIVSEQSEIEIEFNTSTFDSDMKTVRLPDDLYITNEDGTHQFVPGSYNNVTVPTEDGVHVLENDEFIEIFSYESVEVDLRDYTGSGNSLNDSFASDNSFCFYGGKRNQLRVEYCTSLDNPFAKGMIQSLQSILSTKWDYTLETKEGGGATSGYDIYIFEHILPQILPTDGLVVLLDPASTAPAGSGLTLEERIVPGPSSSNYATFDLESDHEVLLNIKPSSFIVSKYVSVIADQNYEVLMKCNSDAVALLNEVNKVFILSYNVHFAQSINVYFPILLSNVFNYFYPQTVPDYLFDVGETIDVRSITDKVTLQPPVGEGTTVDVFPHSLSLDMPGNYVVTQSVTYSTDNEDENATNVRIFRTDFFVKVPSAESEIDATVYTLVGPHYEIPDPEDFMHKLLLYFAIALVVLIVAEWWLQYQSQL